MTPENLLLAWLDLCNTFGSVPHEVISVTLPHLGVPDSVVNLMTNVYMNATTEVRMPAVKCLLFDVQKSARPTEGCYKHTFILQSLILDAK
jgi:hypothetical protein